MCLKLKILMNSQIIKLRKSLIKVQGLKYKNAIVIEFLFKKYLGTQLKYNQNN